jgi:hypothetical protein
LQNKHGPPGQRHAHDVGRLWLLICRTYITIYATQLLDNIKMAVDVTVDEVPSWLDISAVDRQLLVA